MPSIFNDYVEHIENNRNKVISDEQIEQLRQNGHQLSDLYPSIEYLDGALSDKSDIIQVTAAWLSNEPSVNHINEIYQCTTTSGDYTQGYWYKGTIDGWSRIDSQPSGGSGGGAVNSVNNKTGDVILDALDVSAVPQVTGEFLYNGGSKIEDPKWQDRIVQCVEDFVLRESGADYRAGYFYYIDNDGDLREQIDVQPQPVIPQTEHIQKTGAELNDAQDLEEGNIYQCTSTRSPDNSTISNGTQFHQGYFYLFNGEQAQYTYTRIDTQPQGGAVDSVNGQTGVVVLTASDVGAYEKPAAGIPKTDLASDVQLSLDKADSALQDERTVYQKFIDKYNLTQRDWVDLQIIDTNLKCYTSFDDAISDINDNDFSNAIASAEDAVCQIFIEDDIIVLRLLSNWTLKDKLVITSSVIIDFNGFTITLSSDNEYQLVPQGDSVPDFTPYTYYKNNSTSYYLVHDTTTPSDWETNYYTDYYTKISSVGMIGDLDNLEFIDGTLIFYGAKYGSKVTNDSNVSIPSTTISYSILANFKYVYFIGGLYEKQVVDTNRWFVQISDTETTNLNVTLNCYNAYFNLIDNTTWSAISSSSIYSNARYNSQIKINIYNCKFYSKATNNYYCYNILTTSRLYGYDSWSGNIAAYNSKFEAYSARGSADISTNAIVARYKSKLYNCEIVGIHAGLSVHEQFYAQNCKMTAPGHGGVYVASSATPTTNVARGYNGSSSATTMTKTYSFNSSSRPIILNPDTPGIQAYQGKYIRRIQLYTSQGGWLAIGATTCKPWDGDTYDSSNFNNYMNFYIGSAGYKNIYLPKPFYIPSDQYIFISHSPDVGGSPAIAYGTPDTDSPNVVSFWEKNENDSGFTFVDDTIGINLIASKTGDVATFIAENCQFYQKQVDEIPMWNNSAAYCGYGSTSYFNNCSFEVDRLGEYRNVIAYDALKPWGTYDIYEKISDNNYSLLTEEPVDWSSNYSNYYRLIPDVVTVKNGETIYNTTASFSNCKFQDDNIRIDGNNTVYGGEGLSDRIKAVIQLSQGASHLSEDRYDYFNYNDVPTQDYTTKQYVDDKTELLNNVDDTPTQNSNNLITSGGVYSAIANAAPHYELIEKVVIGYSITTSEPADWSTNYTDYYTNTGTSVNPTYTSVTGATAPTWEAETYYSYDPNGVEILDIQSEPNGNNYNFKRLYIQFEQAGTTNINGAFFFGTSQFSASIEKYGTFVTALNNSSSQNHVIMAGIDGNFGYYFNWWGPYNRMSDYSRQIIMSDGEKSITSIRLRRTSNGSLISGTEIYIYGERA